MKIWDRIWGEINTEPVNYPEGYSWSQKIYYGIILFIIIPLVMLILNL